MKLTFTAWLLQQTHRDDPVGNLANDAAHLDKDRPASVVSYQNWMTYLWSKTGDPVVKFALTQAGAEYQKALNNDDSTSQ